MRLTWLVVSLTVSLAGTSSAQTIYTDDPAAAAAVAGWFATLPVNLPSVTPPAAATQVDPDIANAIAPYLGAGAAVGVGPPGDAGVIGMPGIQAPPASAGSTGPAGLGACTADFVRTTSEPMLVLIAAEFERAAARGVRLFGNGEPWLTFEANLRGLPFPGYSEDLPYTLAEAAALDLVNGGTYWTARWHQYHSMVHASFVVRSIGTALGAAGTAVADALPPRWANPLPQDERVTDDEARAAFEPYLALRTLMLDTIRQWIVTLEASECAGPADFVRVWSSLILANDGEYQAFRDRGREYWAAFALAGFFDSGIFRTPGLGFGDATAAVDRLLEPVTVESILGPLPAMPADASYDAAVIAQSTMGNGRPLDPVVSPGDIAVTEANRLGFGNWDQPVTTDAGALPAASPDGGRTEPVTLIDAARATSVSAVGLAGLWRVVGQYDTFVVIRVDDDGRRFIGRIAGDAAASPWLDMTRQGNTSGWRGTIDVTANACRYATEGVFIADAASATLTGVRVGDRALSATCAEAEPEGAAIVLERVVGSTFQPIVAGRYIRIAAVPGNGGVRAAVEFTCNATMFPAGSHRVAVSGGTVVETADCRYQLLAAVPGPYDIVVEFLGAMNEVIHTDHLRVEVPAIPGVFP